MLGLFRKKRRPRVFLGTLAVAPRTDLRRCLEQDGNGTADNHARLQRALTEIFDLPPLSELSAPDSTDLGLDVVVTRFQAGGAWGIDVEAGGFAGPIFWLWAPKIDLGARLYRAATLKTIYTFRIRERLGWRELLRRITNGTGFVFDWQDLESLLCRASYRLLAQVRQKTGA